MDEPQEHQQTIIIPQAPSASKETPTSKHDHTSPFKPTKAISKQPTRKTFSFSSLEAQQKYKRFKTHIKTGLPVDFTD